MGWVSVATSVWLGPSRTEAHDVTVDGMTTDWFSRVPAQTNVGAVIRESMERGELTWSDVSGDHRTDLVGNDIADLERFSITGTATNLFILADLGPQPIASPIDPWQLQVAIDLDRTSGSGQVEFGGFADTRVSEEARWEFLIQTRTDASGTSLRVLDASFTPVSMPGTIAVSPSGIVEIRVPWSTLGLARPPTAFRVSVATFRENRASGDTRDIGGSSTSNAVDVISNYGAPATTPNTWNEVRDGSVDYFLEVWMSDTGEVVAPLQIVRIVPNPPGAVESQEWFVLRNQTGGTLTLSDFKVGDEETARQTAESMRRFPSGSTIAAGAEVFVTNDAEQFRATYGGAPDYEMAGTSSEVPDLTVYAAWYPMPAPASPTFALGNSGDELLVLDRSDTIVDAVSYGSSTFLGMVAMLAPAENYAAFRSPVSQDTDNNRVDFMTVPLCSRSDPAACPGDCRICGRYYACDVAPAGTSCADADLCDGTETCDAEGICVPGTPLSCEDGNPCTIDSCEAASGCVTRWAEPGTACDDGDPCTSGDVCDAVGSCGGSLDPRCTDAGMTSEGDAGMAVEDAGMTSEGDAGMAVEDAGMTSEGDAGMTAKEDAAAAQDAGGRDGAADRDGGARDAATGNDAGVPGSGGGGCGCRAIGAGGSGVRSLVFYLGFALAWTGLRRRRR
jgi:hypothetical protein